MTKKEHGPIYNNRKYFTLGGCFGPERWIHMKKIDQSTITENISLWEGDVVLKGEYIWKKIDQSTITENISLWEGVFGILDMSRYSIVFACIDWSKSTLDT